MLRGLCPGCGELVSGWALRVPKYNKCPQCGLDYLLSENEQPFQKNNPRILPEYKPIFNRSQPFTEPQTVE